MNLNPLLTSLATDAAAQSAGPVARCEVANFRWEEAISAARAAQYNEFADQATSHAAWRAEHKAYVASYTHVAKDSPICAEAFLPVNSDAQLLENLDDKYLLRLESFRRFEARPLIADTFRQFWERFFNYPKDLVKSTPSEADKSLADEFFRLWNDQIRLQSRPMFAAFLDDFGGNLSQFIKTGWPHILRDRLGLSYLTGTPQQPLPVALMCYRLDEVRQARQMASKKGATASFSRPTVLDAEMSAAFVPAPLFTGGESYGHTLDLSSSADSASFSPELLTYPIDYLPRHIKALGFITQGHALMDDASWLPARNRHVQGLRQRPECADFGEILT